MLVMELHFFERLTVTNPPFGSEQELHFGCCVQEVPLQRRRAIIPVCSLALFYLQAVEFIGKSNLSSFLLALVELRVDDVPSQFVKKLIFIN